MDSERSMNTTVDPNSTIWKSEEANRTSPQLPSIPLLTVDYAKAAAFWVIFVVGVIGNLLVITAGVIGHGKGNKGQTLVTRMFICCLAISDLGLMLTGVWTSAMSAITPSWSYGIFVCKLNTFWSSMASKASVTMLSVISIDRYLGLSQPGMMSYFSPRTAALLIAIICLVVISASVPIFLWTEVVRYSPTLQRCSPSGVNKLAQALYSLITMVILFFVPLAVTLTSYFGIWYKMYFAKKKVTPSGMQQSPDNTAARKVARMCTVIVAVFVVSSMPLQIGLIVLFWGSSWNDVIPMISPLSILADLNSCINPIVYGIMWKPMRATLKQIFCKPIFGRKTSENKKKTQASHITSVA